MAKEVTCKEGEIKVFRHASCAKSTGKSTINCASLPILKCRSEGGDQCTIRAMGHYCTKDTGKPGRSETKIPIIEKGKLTRLFNEAGVPLEKGKVIDGMTAPNCVKLGTYMAKNVAKWNEPGKDPRREARGMLSVLALRTDMPEERKKRIITCADIVMKSIAPVQKRME